MDSRVHGNDDEWCGGGALSFYGIVSLLMCLISSFFCLLASLCFSVSPNVILANAGIHRTASVVARYYRFIASVVGFALCSCWLWRVCFQTWHLACVDEWISVRTGMTAGGAAAVKYYIGGKSGW
ncbi:hypothetical protein [Vibrio vulnificus]|uniref:hypothetical protein n=2 Tax=Vibrio vulnificus TaxID=672 RepID=UPI001F5F0562|nr:hypothetical protein [Vibrio vulnificus]